MNDPEAGSTLDPEAPTPPPFTPQVPPAYPAPVPAARPRLVDRVLGMRAVIGVALAGLILGGAGGAVLGATTNDGDDGFGGHGPRGFPGGQRGTFPGPGQPFQGPGHRGPAQ